MLAIVILVLQLQRKNGRWMTAGCVKVTWPEVEPDLVFYHGYQGVSDALNHIRAGGSSTGERTLPGRCGGQDIFFTQKLRGKISCQGEKS